MTFQWKSKLLKIPHINKHNPQVHPEYELVFYPRSQWTSITMRSYFIYSLLVYSLSPPPEYTFYEYNDLVCQVHCWVHSILYRQLEVHNKYLLIE